MADARLNSKRVERSRLVKAKLKSFLTRAPPMAIGQMNRSALRRALQRSFFEGTESMLRLAHRRGLRQTRFSASWRWMLTLACIKFHGDSDGMTPDEIRSRATELGLHPSTRRPSHTHHDLFSVTGMASMSDDALIAGMDAISCESITKKITKELRIHDGSPWDHILPEDIGSCYEIMKETRSSEAPNVLSLVQQADRRSAGIHHTPFDVTSHMVESALEDVVTSNENPQGQMIICDIAVGAGAFILQACRKLSESSGLEPSHHLMKSVIGFDIDSEVLLVASLCFFIESDFPEQAVQYHLHCLDSLDGEKSRDLITKKVREFAPSSGGLPDIVIGNPPYVRALRSDWENHKFKSLACWNISAYFLEQALNCAREGGVVSQIVPLALTQASNTISIRQIMEERSTIIRIQAFDCVPGYLFDQGKVGSNSNSSITQRVAIVTCTIGQGTPRIESTRLTRWRSDERNNLFSRIDGTTIPLYLRTGHSYPMLGDNRMKRALKHAISTRRQLSDITNPSGKLRLFVPKAIRYFATASRLDMNREQHNLRFATEQDRDTAQILINSSFFYWYWRVFGNGFQISTREIGSIPLPAEEVTSRMHTEIRAMADKLHNSRKRLAVTKSNKGQIRNIKYDLDGELMREMDHLVHRMFGFPEHFQFKAIKANNISDYESLWR